MGNFDPWGDFRPLRGIWIHRGFQVHGEFLSIGKIAVHGEFLSMGKFQPMGNFGPRESFILVLAGKFSSCGEFQSMSFSPAEFQSMGEFQSMRGSSVLAGNSSP